VRIALAQINATVGDLAGNAALCRAEIGRAAAAGADLVVFPELAITGYPPRDLLDRDVFCAASRATIEALAAATRGTIAALVGYVERAPQGARRPALNCAAFLQGGRWRSSITKRLLPTYDVFDEDRYFVAGEEAGIIEVAGHTIGVTICEDLWTEEGWRERHYRFDPAAECVAAGAELIVNLSASPFHDGKSQRRVELLQAHARRHGVPLAMANLVGGNDELIFDGASVAVTADGTVLAQAAAFAPDLVIADFDAPHGDLRAQPADRLDAMWRALVLGLRDYIGKCGFQSAVLGLSGGVDSALVACLAADALGAAHVRCIAMPGPFSSGASEADARALADRLGTPFEVIPIEGVYEQFRTALKPLFGDRPFDVAEENLQARIRGTLLMASSNKFGEILLTTGNKSEMAVGYSTLYGDMAGGLAVIADVAKTDVYRLCEHRNARADDPDVIPSHTLTRPPSAELRPDQKDTDSLPPYAVLDDILEAFVEESLSPAAIAARGHDPAVVRRVVGMIERNEYKRRQAPPGLRVTSRAFGMGRRVPIARHLDVDVDLDPDQGAGS
jgi:NAD+ synthetase